MNNSLHLLHRSLFAISLLKLVVTSLKINLTKETLQKIFNSFFLVLFIGFIIVIYLLYFIIFYIIQF